MLDELPMLYLAIVMLYILLENRPARRFGAWFPLLLVAHAALVTYLCTFTRGRLQFWTFQLSFSSVEFLGLYLVYRIHRASHSAELRRLFRTGIALYGLALLLWFTDLRFCDALQALARHGVPNPQLHAIWHVLVSAGFYLLLLVVAHDRLRVLGRQPRIRFRAFVPYLRLE
jgi:dihydroceramidase